MKPVFPEADNYSSIIIFGRGKDGQAVFKYLNKTGRGEKVRCFADHDTGRREYYKGIKIVSPEAAKKLYENALWVVSSRRNALQIRDQLEKLGIERADILQITYSDIRVINKCVHKYWREEGKYFMYEYGCLVNLRFVLRQAKNALYGMYYDSLAAMKDPPDAPSHRYDVSICAIFLNEAPYMREWIEFHRMVGVEHFYLYNNMSTDGYEQILAPYVEAGIVTLIDWDVPHGQISAYRDCVKRFSEETRWVGFIDLDEFVVPREKGYKIYDFLKQYNDRWGAVLIYWKIFGSSGMYGRDLDSLVTEDFRKCWSKLDEIGKCFYNTRYPMLGEDRPGLALYHVCWTWKRGKVRPPVNVYGKVSVPWMRQRASNEPAPLQINHYITKSYGEYRKKIMQPDATCKTNPHSDEHFHFYDERAVATDSTIDQYLRELKQRLGR